MFAESPSNYYEWIEPRLISKPDSKQPLFSTFKPSKPIQSAHTFNSQVTQSSARHDVCSKTFSVDGPISKRPLPPIPNEPGNPQPDTGLYRKYRNATSVDPSRWQSRVKGNGGSKPLIRSGSEPNLVAGEEQREPRLSSSQSLECLDVVDSRPTENRPFTNYFRLKPNTTTGFHSLPRHCLPPHEPESSEKMRILQQPSSSVDLGVPQQPESSIKSAVLQQLGNRQPRPLSNAPAVTSGEDGKTASAAVRVRPPPPPSRPPPPDEVVQNLRPATTRISMLRRQRPVSTEMRRRSSGAYHLSSPVEHTSNITSPGYQDTAADANHSHTLPVRCAIVYRLCLFSRITHY